MIYYIGNPVEGVPVSSFASFMDWAYDQPEYEFDVETNVTDDEVRLKKIIWCTKKLITVQFGSIKGKVGTVGGDVQWVIQWSFLTDEQKAFIKYLLEGKKTKLIHNAAFECIVCLFHGIRVQNVYDTMLMEMILNCGLLNYANDEDEEADSPEEGTFYSLSMTCFRYLCIYLDKSEVRMQFGNDLMTIEGIIYAANDVKYLSPIRRLQILEIQANDLDYVAALENEAVLGFSMMTYNGMELNVEKWRDNIALATPLVEQARVDLAKSVIDDDMLREHATNYGWYDTVDRLIVNWNSPPQKSKIFAKFFPMLPGASKAVLLKWLKSGLGTEIELECVVPMVKEGNYSAIERYIQEEDREWLIENEMLIPGGELTINWDSAPQKLKLLQKIHPKLEKTDKRALEKVKHVVIEYLVNYSKTRKLLTTYGEKFILHIEPDGKIRSTFKQVVSTGRISSSPNLQNIPIISNDDPVLSLRYRNSFICDADEEYVGSDYISQELVIMAYISGEPAWIDALKKKKDLHSVCAELIASRPWKAAAEPGCWYYNTHVNKDTGELIGIGQKCNCKGHKKLRVPYKNLNFGLPYGMSKFKLAADLKISVSEAEAIIADYARTFPKIWRMLKLLGEFGVTNGYIMTLTPFFRKRWFPFWKYAKSEIHHFIAGIIHNSTLGSIERQSKNQPIQGTAADCTKVALCMVYWYIFDNNLSDKVKLRVQVHDALDTTAKKHYSAEWKVKLTELMEEAALFSIPNGLLKAETNITEVWSK